MKRSLVPELDPRGQTPEYGARLPMFESAAKHPLMWRLTVDDLVSAAKLLRPANLDAERGPGSGVVFRLADTTERSQLRVYGVEVRYSPW